MRLTDHRLALCLLAALAPLAGVHAELTVVADHGGAPARAYYAPIAPAGVGEDEAYSAREEARSRGPVREADLLPVRSARLTPGRVEARSLELPAGMSAFFIVGADALSRRWLAQRGPRLRALHAVGLVVNVKTAAQLQALRRAGDGLVLRPVAGDDIAERLDLAHYPVLITSQGVQQ